MAKADSPSELVRCAIYTRVSSEEQAKKGYSLDAQERMCRDALDQKYGLNLYEVEVYADEGYSHRWGLYDPEHPNRKFRPGLTRLVEAFKESKHQVLCLWELDRLYRRPALTEFLDQHFIPYGLEQIISLREDADFKTASGRLNIDVMAATAAFEVARLGERVSDSLDQRRHEGYAIGPPPYGWRWQTENETAQAGQRRRGIAPVDEEGEIVRWMAERYLAGDSILTITQQLNERGVPTNRGGKRWSRSSVKRILANPKQAGLLEVEDGEFIEAQHYEHRHYDPEVFHQLRARMERNAQNHSGSAHVPEYLLGGLIRCGHCGHPLNCRRVNRTNRRYYRCSTGCSRGTDTMCTRNSKPADVVDAVVLSKLKEIAAREDVGAAAAQALETMVDVSDERLRDDVERLEQQLEDAWGKYGHWSDRHYDGDLTEEEFEFHRQRFLEQKDELEQKLSKQRAQLRSREQRAAELQQAQEVLRDFDATFEGLTPEQRRQMVQLLVEDATMYHEKDGSTRVVFTVRFHGQFEHVIPKLTGGKPTLTIRQMEVYKLLADGLDRNEIARKLGIGPSNVTVHLWNGRKRAGAETYNECYEMVRDEIEKNEAILFTGRRRRKRPKDPDKPPLTPRQAEILGLKAEGLKADEIAERLGIAANTVYVQLDNCRHRLGRITTEAAIKHAKEMGYV